MIASLNEQARAGAVRDVIHGVEVHDPYRALETESDLTNRWIEGQTERSRNELERWSSAATRTRLETLLSIGSIDDPARGGERVFYTKREGDREQPQLVVAQGETVRPVLDPLDYGDRAALDWFVPSPTGRFVAFGISENGDERSTLRVLDVEAETVREHDIIPRAKWSNVAWLHSEDGFYYTRYPSDGEEGFDPENPDTYFPRVFFHRLGTDPGTDPRVFGSQEGTDFPYPSLSDDDRWVTINVFRGWSESDVFLFDRGAQAARRRDSPGDESITTVVAGADYLSYGDVHRGQLYLATNQDAPRYKILRVSASAPDQPPETAVAESEGSIEGFEVAGDTLVVHRIEGVRSRIAVYPLTGPRDEVGEAWDLALPGYGKVGGFTLSTDGREGSLQFSGYDTPPTIFSFGATEDLAVVDRIEAEATALRVTRDEVRSEDGTVIPVTLLHSGPLARTGERPTLVTGYGGFNVSLLPSFTRHALYWTERGGVFVVANLRGGGEFGEAWHRDGNLDNKENVFDDFEAVLRWLSSSGITAPERIAITGGSNGGLLMGAMITRCPDAFRAAASYVGLYDMVRYHQFPPAQLWASEYGSSETPEEFAWLRAYSPYHRVEGGRAYPWILIETADHDSRVHWAHSTKFTARLQEATSSENPILFFMERSVGHGAGTRRSDTVARYTRMYAFIERALGMTPFSRDR